MSLLFAGTFARPQLEMAITTVTWYLEILKSKISYVTIHLLAVCEVQVHSLDFPLALFDFASSKAIMHPMVVLSRVEMISLT